MGSPVSVIAANFVMEDVEERIFRDDRFSVSLHCFPYIDDTWVVLPGSEVNSFSEFINGVEESIIFTSECEDKDNSIFGCESHQNT